MFDSTKSKLNKSNISIFIGIMIFVVSFMPFAPSGLILLNFLIGLIGMIGTLLNKEPEPHEKNLLFFLNFFIFLSFFVGMYLGYIIEYLRIEK